MPKKLTLYNYFRSSASYRVRIALNIKGLDYDYKPVHLLNNGGEQHLEPFKSKNPMRQVPSLGYQGMVINQSMAIIIFLEDNFPEPSLFGDNLYEKAKIIEFCEIINSGIQGFQNLSILQYLDNNLKLSPEQKKEWLNNWIHKGLESLESMVSEGSQFFALEQMTAAECFLIPQLFSSRRVGIDLDKYPKLLAIEENCQELAPIISAHPKNQPDSQ